MCTGRAAGREPWLAVALSLFAPGLGQIYCGEIVRGLVLFLASLLFTPLVLLAALLPPATPVLVALIAAAAAVLGAYLYAVLAAYRSARRLREQFQPREYNRPLVYALFLLVGVLYPVGGAWYLPHVFEAFYLPTESMAPTFLAGDRVLADKLAYRQALPKRGDVVIFRVPRKPGFTWIKRVVGLPGDTVEVKDGEVFVNGKRLDRDRVPAVSLLGSVPEGAAFVESNAGSRYLVLLGKAKGPDYPRATVPEGSLFVLGDHRDRSADSRDPELGFVPLGAVLGNVPYIYYPAGSWDRFGAVRPGAL
ncbi:MAG TPA: signal peptidase I [Gemmataceae bacterium]|nr:signal peptidase I [Gemmataceae bacterium]